MASDVPDDQGQSLLSQRTVFNLKETVRRLQTVGNRIEPTNLLVVAVERYQVDGNFYVETGRSENDQSHSYDITLSDGTHLIKCILAAKLNIDVQQNKLYAGCVVRLLDCKLHYNETSLKAESYLIIEDLDCLQIDVPHLQTDSVTFWPGASRHEKSNEPLAVSRECYLALWNDSDPYGDPWNTEVIPTKLPNRAIPSITNIGKVVEKWQRVRLQKPYPPILGRILSKARLHYYGKPSRLREKWPYQAGFVHLFTTFACYA
ncbi:RPA-related protein RADX-like [Ptychodera flava]|uniref:RPA-related protein RADX-like n=1 Tax=Ptychodera flava TaxID=63121 RepID=UPI003969FD16